MSLRIVPVDRDDAKAFTRMWHRHHGHVLPASHRFSQGVADGDDFLLGVAITGRPVARGNQDGVTVEVTRCTTDGTENACSILYGAAARAAKALGWGRIITYTQEGESGASLKAAGFVVAAELDPRGGWDMPARPRKDHGTGGGPALPVGAGPEPVGEAMEGAEPPRRADRPGDAADAMGGGMTGDAQAGTFHAHPLGDLIEHQLDDDCPCGPRQEPVRREDGSVGWLAVHSSLDGREKREDAAARKAG